MADYFGKVDGASESASSFIKFSGPRWGDLSMAPSERRVRILVGRRGSGKSRYISVIERDAAHSDTNRMLVFPQRNERLWVPQIRWLHKTYSDDHERVQVWSKLWGAAAYTSIASFLVNYKPPTGTSTNLLPEDRDYLANFCRDRLGSASASFTIVRVLNEFVKRYQDRSRLDSFVNEPYWVELEERVLRTISTATPIACYVDAVDDAFEASPSATTDCMVGLLEWIMHKSLDNNVSNRIHVVTTVRDTVYAALMQRGNAQRFDRSVIRCLDWSRAAADFFLTEKIKQLPIDAKLSKDRALSPIASWLGMTEISNPTRGSSKESISDLIIRHTRFLPREIIEIGNALSSLVAEQKAAGALITDHMVAEVIMNQARLSADWALQTVADHMIALDSDHDRTVVAASFRNSVWREIHHTFIANIGDERFSRATLEQAEAAYAEALGGWQPTIGWRQASLGEVLWLHGLIGYEDVKWSEPVVKYFSSSSELQSDNATGLPEAEYYYLHSALLRPSRMGIEPEPPNVGEQ